MNRTFRWLIAAALFASSVTGQQLSVSISPNPAPLGTTITVTAQAAVTPGLFTPFGCLLSGVRSGTPNGPVVKVFGCTFLPGAIPLFGSGSFRTGTWDQTFTGGGVASPGLYWFEIQHSPQMFGGPISIETYCVTIDDPASPVPVLSAVNAPLFGSVFQLSLVGGAAHAFEVYGVALAATTNTGIPFPGGFACLDPDALLFFSLAQDPNFFVNFSGTLDFQGTSPPIAIVIPPVIGVTCIPIHAQAVVFSSGGAVVLSNDLTISIH